MATLVHDDVIDDAETRRGRKTVKAQWDNRVAMYTGDYIFARSLQVGDGNRRSRGTPDSFPLDHGHVPGRDRSGPGFYDASRPSSAISGGSSGRRRF